MKRLVVVFMIIVAICFSVGCKNNGCKNNSGDTNNYDLSNVSFNDMNVIYDGEEHSVLLSGELPEGLEVEYQNNKLLSTKFFCALYSSLYFGIISFNF